MKHIRLLNNSDHHNPGFGCSAYVLMMWNWQQKELLGSWDSQEGILGRSGPWWGKNPRQKFYKEIDFWVLW